MPVTAGLIQMGMQYNTMWNDTALHAWAGSNLKRVEQEEQPGEDCSVLVHSKQPNDPSQAHQRHQKEDGLDKFAASRNAVEGGSNAIEVAGASDNTSQYFIPFSTHLNVCWQTGH